MTFVLSLLGALVVVIMLSACKVALSPDTSRYHRHGSSMMTVTTFWTSNIVRSATESKQT